MTIDIMLPHYGDTALLQAAVNSIRAQTDPHWRLTVVDDGQAPGVPEWFAALDDPQVRYIRNEQNLGITLNFQKCVDLAEHDHLTLMGTDDVMLPNYVATVRAILAEHPKAALIQPRVDIIDAAGKVTNTLVDHMKRSFYAPQTRNRLIMEGEDLAVSLLRGNWLYFPSLCWRTDAIRRVRFRPELRVIQDLALIIELVQLDEQLVVDPTLCFRYRRHAESVSSADAIDGRRFVEARTYFVETAERMRAHGWPRAARAARQYLSSRLHAASMLPAAVLARQGGTIRVLARHAFGPGRP
jgi:glycosyltransferase involved in cell wall biosynthesis